MSKLKIFRELFHFMVERKKWCLLPMIIIMIMLGMLLAFAHTSPLAPFIYTLI